MRGVGIKLFIPVVCLLCTPYALANPGVGDAPVAFEFTQPGGPIPEEGLSIFPLIMANLTCPRFMYQLL